MRFVDKDVMVARRDIKKGEELYYDYATSESNDYMYMDCLCGAPQCRKVITGKDYRLPQLQELYKGHFLPYLQRKMDKEKEERKES